LKLIIWDDGDSREYIFPDISRSLNFWNASCVSRSSQICEKQICERERSPAWRKGASVR